jgi:hypothetical protein
MSRESPRWQICSCPRRWQLSYEAGEPCNAHLASVQTPPNFFLTRGNTWGTDHLSSPKIYRCASTTTGLPTRGIPSP